MSRRIEIASLHAVAITETGSTHLTACGIAAGVYQPDSLGSPFGIDDWLGNRRRYLAKHILEFMEEAAK